MEHSLNRTAASATLHCLTGCAIGEVLGMVVTSYFGMAALPSITISVVLAFLFGYMLSMLPLVRSGLSWRKAIGIALAADTVSITVMELSDNGFILAIPGAIHAGLDTLLFWMSLTVSLAVAFMLTLPINRYLIARGKGHALAHQYHRNHHDNS